MMVHDGGCLNKEVKRLTTVDVHERAKGCLFFYVSLRQTSDVSGVSPHPLPQTSCDHLRRSKSYTKCYTM